MRRLLSYILILLAARIFAADIVLDRRGMIFSSENNRYTPLIRLPDELGVPKDIFYIADDRFWALCEKGLAISRDRFRSIDIITVNDINEMFPGKDGIPAPRFPFINDVYFNNDEVLVVSDSRVFYKGRDETSFRKAKLNGDYLFCGIFNGDSIYIGTSQNGVICTSKDFSEIKRQYGGFAENIYTAETNYFEEIAALEFIGGELFSFMNFGYNIFIHREGKWQKQINFYNFENIECVMCCGNYITLNFGKRNDILLKNGVLLHSVDGYIDKDDIIAGIFFENGYVYKKKERTSPVTGRPLRAVHIPTHRLKHFIENMGEYRKMGFNAVVIPFKDDDGHIIIKPENRLFVDAGAAFYNWNMKSIIEKIKNGGFTVIARVVCFKDEILFNYKGGEFAFWDKNLSTPWKGKKGERWVDPYSSFVRDYLILFIKELQRFDIDEIQLDYIRFPTDGLTDNIISRYRQNDVSKESMLERFLADVRENCKVTLSLDVYGLMGWNNYGGNPGQVIKRFAPYADVLCPMLYPSHFDDRFLGQYEDMDRAYNIIFYGVKRNMEKYKTLYIRPYIQAFNYRIRGYSNEYIMTQIRALKDAGTEQFTLWGLQFNNLDLENE